jgi:hypothetical protein
LRAKLLIENRIVGLGNSGYLPSAENQATLGDIEITLYPKTALAEAVMSINP